MKNTVIADTGFWIALANQKDQYHELAKQCLHELSIIKVDFITTCAVMNETAYLLYRRIGREAQRKFITHYQNGLFSVFEIRLEHAPRINQLMDKYADLPMDFADASLVILAEDLKNGRILSTDRRDFQTYRWKNHKPFENLLLFD